MSYMPMKMPFEPGSPYGQKSGYPEQLPPQPGTRDIEEPGTAPLGPPGAGGPPGTFGSDPGNVPVGGWYGGPRYGGGRYGGPRGGWGGGYGWGPPRGGYGGGYGGPMRGGGGYGQPSQTTRAYAPPPFGVVGDGPGGTIPENFKPTPVNPSVISPVEQASPSSQTTPAPPTAIQYVAGGQPVPQGHGYGQWYGGPRGGYGGYAPPRMGGVRYNPYDPPRFPQQPLLQQGGVLQANNANGIKPQQPPQLFPTGGIKPARTPEAMTKPQASPYQTPPIAAGMETDEEKKKRAMLAPEQPGMPMTKPELM